MQSVKCSVVIPLFNKAPFILRALESVLNQTFHDFECIVVDDGSTDGGSEIVHNLNDPRIRLITQTNSGVSAARNRGINEADGKYIAFLDADDEWKQDFLQTVLNLCQKYPDCGAYSTAYEIIAPWHQLIKPNYSYIPQPPWEGIIPNYFKTALRDQTINSSTAFIPKKIFDMIGLFPVGELLGEDLDMWCRIALHFPIAFSTKVCAVYHQESDLRACNTSNLIDYQLTKTIDNFLNIGSKPYDSSITDLINYKNSMHIQCAKSCLFNGMGFNTRYQLRQCILTKKEKLLLLYLYIISYMPKIMPHIALWLKFHIAKWLCGVRNTTTFSDK